MSRGRSRQAPVVSHCLVTRPQARPPPRTLAAAKSDVFHDRRALLIGELERRACDRVRCPPLRVNAAV